MALFCHYNILCIALIISCCIPQETLNDKGETFAFKMDDIAAIHDDTAFFNAEVTL